LSAETKNLVVIIGPTGVGKSAVAILLAGEFEGEIINCDSMQVYKGFDIGTDKPPLSERRGIPHHLLGIAEPSTQFTAAEFARLAREAIEDILQRGKLPFVVGGTGLYLSALLEGLFPGPGKDAALRRSLEQEAEEKGLESLRRKLEAVDPTYAAKVGEKDKVRIIRALEVFYLTGKPLSEHFANTSSSLEDFHLIKIGLELERGEMNKKIEERVDRMFERGIVREVEFLLARGVAPDCPPFRALGYKHVLQALEKKISLEEARSRTKLDTRHYAKRQMTWFRKMKDITWFSPYDLPAIIQFVKDNLLSL
jgi:tRNA dimethylallyltransferase